MPDADKTTRPEINFLPPLKMVLSLFDRETRKPAPKPEDTVPVDTKQFDVKRIIDRLNEDEGKNA